MLASWGVEFDPVNVEGNPEARRELERRGVTRVPALAVGDRVVHGWNPSGYAELLGVPYTAPPRLGPAELASRLDAILEAAERLIGEVPVERLDWRPPERDRTLRDLGFHVFRLALAFAQAVDRGELPEAWLQERAPVELGDGAALAGYGASVRARLAAWFAGAGDDGYARTVRAYYGLQSGHELLERTAWHAAQHLRQLYVLAERLGLEPPAPLPVHAFAGLPLPESLW